MIWLWHRLEVQSLEQATDIAEDFVSRWEMNREDPFSMLPQEKSFQKSSFRKNVWDIDHGKQPEQLSSGFKPQI